MQDSQRTVRANPPVCWLCGLQLNMGGWQYTDVPDEEGRLHPAHEQCAKRVVPAFTVQPAPKFSDGDGYLECPCCGGIGKEADGVGEYVDGEDLDCGCAGFVRACVGDVWIDTGDEPCLNCEQGDFDEYTYRCSRFRDVPR